jgi:protein-arginine kinase activator protein McsA
MTWTCCKDCGNTFERPDNEAWRVRCTPCYKVFKRAETSAVDSYWPDRAAAAESAAATLKRRVATLEGVIGDLMNKPKSGYLEDEIREHLRGLLQCCHPDRHNGSEGATRTTQWLLSVKQRISQSNPW